LHSHYGKDFVVNVASMRVVKLGEHIGATVDGVFLTRDLDSAVAAALNAALLEHKVVFFRGQHHLDDDGHLGFAETMGTPTSDPDPSVSVLDSEHTGRVNVWHTDTTFAVQPPKASILRAVTLPDWGGTTLWANTAAAYQQLPKPLRHLADGLWARHDDVIDDTNLSPELVGMLPDGDNARREIRLAPIPFETEHPVVQVHPETGEPALLLGAHARRILDVSSEESRTLFRLFQDRITRPEFTVRWSWEPGDVAMWDNRATQHYAVADYGNQRRVMRRVTLAGRLPVSVTGEHSRLISGHACSYTVVDDR
jgi:alpha-ketoglutarate-dependent sulfate ester dioxygenase